MTSSTAANYDRSYDGRDRQYGKEDEEMGVRRPPSLWGRMCIGTHRGTRWIDVDLEEVPSNFLRNWLGLGH